MILVPEPERNQFYRSVPIQIVVSHLGKIDAVSVHVQAVKKTGEALGESRKALMHELEMHEICFEIGHAIAQLGELGLERVQRIVLSGISGLLGIAQRGPRRGPQRRGRSRWNPCPRR
jgi:hypothetical protein